MRTWWCALFCKCITAVQFYPILGGKYTIENTSRAFSDLRGSGNGLGVVLLPASLVTVRHPDVCVRQSPQLYPGIAKVPERFEYI